MQSILAEYAERVERETGFVERASKMGGAEFVQTLSFGWLSNSDATLEELAQTAATIGVKMSAQGLEQRFTESGAKLLKKVLDEAVTRLIRGEGPATGAWMK
jgi:predicted naringenin-chalcone synthase